MIRATPSSHHHTRRSSCENRTHLAGENGHERSQAAGTVEGLGAGFRRGSLDDRRRSRRMYRSPRSQRHYLLGTIAAERVVCGKHAGRATQCLRRPCGSPI